MKYQKTADTVANHTQRNYKGGPKIAKAIRDIILPTIVTPTHPTPVAGRVIDKGVKLICQQEVQKTMKRILLLNKKKKHAYALVFGQCLPELISKVKGTGGYSQANQDQDIIYLYLSSSMGTAAASTIISRVHTCSREQNTEQSMLGAVETYGGAYVNNPGLITAQLIELGQPGLANLDKIQKPSVMNSIYCV